MEKYKCNCNFDYLQIEYNEIIEISNYIKRKSNSKNDDLLIKALYVKYPILTEETHLNIPFYCESIIEDSNYVIPYSSNEDTENCNRCIDAGIYVSSLINVGYILIETNLNTQKIDVLVNIIKKLSFYNCKFNKNEIYVNFINKLWDISYTDLKWATLLEILCEQYPKNLQNVIEEIIRESIILSNLDVTLVKYNNEYIKLIQFCSKIKQAFINVILYIRDKMIETNFSNIYNIFLELILKDLKNSINISQYKNMYPDNLINYVLLLSSIENNETSATIINMLKELKIDNYKDFILLITHFPCYKFLIN